MNGLLLFAHGARDAAWARPFEEVRNVILLVQPELAVELCFLEFMLPTLQEGGKALALRGCTQVQIVPLFLGAGGHVRKDLPQLITVLNSDYPHVAWSLQTAVGERLSVIEAMAQECLNAGATIGIDPAERVILQQIEQISLNPHPS